MLCLLAKTFLHPSCAACRRLSIRSCVYSQELDNKYSDLQKERILQIINDNDTETLSRYNINKIKLKKIIDWRIKNGKVKTLSELESIDGFTDKYSTKLCNNILEGPQSPDKSLSKKIKGQVLHPTMPESIRKSCKTVLAIYVTVNSVCWTLMDRSSYKVAEWKYKPIEYPGSKSTKITDILSIAWHITDQLPTADVYVMKAEATTLRASGSDPNNPKVLGVNLQKAQMIAMMVAFINARANGFGHLNPEVEEDKKQFKQKVYFLRPTLPFRSYCTSFYTSRLWINYTEKQYNALRVQYNNAFRMLMGLPRFCSASGMFADAHVDCFYTTMRKRCTSLVRRILASSNGILRAFAGRLDCQYMNGEPLSYGACTDKSSLSERHRARLYGTLVGNERVSTDQTVEMIFQETSEAVGDSSQVSIPHQLQTMYRSQRELQKDMLGHCLLLALTFMDVCVYMNRESIEKLIKRGE